MIKMKGEILSVSKIKIEGWTAVIFQHEIDHLDGILFIDKKCEGDLVPKEEYYEMRKKQKEEAEATKCRKNRVKFNSMNQLIIFRSEMTAENTAVIHGWQGVSSERNS
jgi:hypothetical protein